MSRPTGSARPMPSTLPQATGRATSRTAVAATALAAVVVLTAAVARLGLSGAEAAVFRALFTLPTPIHLVLVTVMPLGSVWAALAVPVLVLPLGRRTAARVLLAGTGAWTAAQVLKAAVDRGRPADVLASLVEVGVGAGPGYPSGHTAVAAALATALWPDLGRLGRVTVATLAALVGLARIEVGAHLPVDVLGGAALGVLVGLGARALVWRATRS